MKKIAGLLFLSVSLLSCSNLGVARKYRESTVNTIDTIEIRKNAKLLTLIDDDGYNTFITMMLPIIKEKKVSISTAIETGKVGKYDYMDWKSIKKCKKRGAEILNHSKYHIYSKEKSQQRTKEDIRQEMFESIDDMVKQGYKHTADIWVYPGASAGSTWSICSEIMRVGINSSGSKVNTYPFRHRYNLSRYPICSKYTHSYEEMKGYIDELAKSSGWEIWMMHSHNGYMNTTFLEDLKKIIDYARSQDIRIVSVKEALDFYGVVNKNISIEK